MKKLIILLALIPIGMFAQRKTHVRSYTKKNGTHVQSHNRTKKNKTERDNWSSKPNYNPETGRKGTKRPKK